MEVKEERKGAGCRGGRVLKGRAGWCTTSRKRRNEGTGNQKRGIYKEHALEEPEK